jgi:site-specific DNA recombinase
MTPKPEQPRRAVGYIRVSTEAQAVDGVSLEAQRGRIEAWCLANEHYLAGLHVDAGVSGKRADNRPGLQAALIEVSGAKGGALVVYSLSRLARSVKDTLEIAGRLDRAGADLVSLSEKIDTTSAAGRMVFRMLAVLAEFERDLCGERTKSALAHKKRLGECIGEVPFGWRRVGDRLTRDQAGQRGLDLIKELRSQGQPFRKIAGELERAGILTAKGGKRWDPKTVHRISEANRQRPPDSEG